MVSILLILFIQSEEPPKLKYPISGLDTYDKNYLLIEGQLPNRKLLGKSYIILNGAKFMISPEEWYSYSDYDKAKFHYEFPKFNGENQLRLKIGKKLVFLRTFYSKSKPPVLRIILGWTKKADIDLYVIEPTGEKCYYGRTRTKIGGRISGSVYSNYGPEIYTIYNRYPGTYVIKAKGYSIYNPTPAFVYVYINEGTPREVRYFFNTVILRSGEEVELARINVSDNL